MGNANKTRGSRMSAGKCMVCLRRRRNAPHVTCDTCRHAMNETSAKRYAKRRQRKTCTRCAGPAEGYLCELHAELRRVRRRGQR